MGSGDAFQQFYIKFNYFYLPNFNIFAQLSGPIHTITDT
jgi:hypothetical protein